MGKRKRTTRRSGLVGRAVSAGRRALREAESRVPPDLRRQLERSLKDADKTARAAIKQLQTQVKRASTRADVNSVLKRIAGLTKQARQIALGRAARATTTKRRAATTTRRAASGAKKAAGIAKRKAPSRACRRCPRPTARWAPRWAAVMRVRTPKASAGRAQGAKNSRQGPEDLDSAQEHRSWAELFPVDRCAAV